MTRRIPLFTVAGVVAAGCGSDAPLHEQVDLEVAIDVLPGTWPNAVGGTTIDVALLARGGIDVTSIDPETLVATDFAATVAVPFESVLREQDVDGDGAIDVIATLPLDPALVERNTRLVVTGETETGDRLTGWDMMLDDARPRLELPELRGSHPVGVVELDWEDAARAMEAGPDPTAPRRIKAQLWYPADLPGHRQLGPAWTSHAESHLVSTSPLAFFLGLDGRFPDDTFEFVGARATPNAPVAAGAKWPVLIFSHGYGIPSPAHAVTVAELASHGFVVVSVYHPYATAPIVFGDGFAINEVGEPPLELWAGDQQFVLDRIEEMAESDPRFAGRLDAARVGVLGMSAGGASAAIVCAADDRFLAGANVDGDLGPVGAIAQDFLLINAAQPPPPGSGREALLDSVEGEAYSLTIPTARHLNFSDLSIHQELLRAYDPAITLPDLGTIDPLLAHEIASSYLVAFFETYVADDPDPLLSEASPWPEAELVRWN